MTASKAMEKFWKLFKRKEMGVIGMIHVQALPGSSSYSLSMKEIINQACEEASIYNDNKLDGILIENMHDVPWQRKGQLGCETVAAMTAVAAAVRQQLPLLPIGCQILSAANREALAVAKAVGLDFIRAEGWVYAHIGDEGYVESSAADVIRWRHYLNADDDVLIFTDIKKKHSSHSITNDVSLIETAQAAELFKSDAVILTGSSTGIAPLQSHLYDVQNSVNLPVLIGSGLTLENLEQFRTAQAFIVGSHFKQDGHWSNVIDKRRVARFMDRVRDLR